MFSYTSKERGVRTDTDGIKPFLFPARCRTPVHQCCGQGQMQTICHRDSATGGKATRQKVPLVFSSSLSILEMVVSHLHTPIKLMKTYRLFFQELLRFAFHYTAIYQPNWKYSLFFCFMNLPCSQISFATTVNPYSLTAE